jgi:pimeloyl-ACP methyl ester carboxylesterase
LGQRQKKPVVRETFIELTEIGESPLEDGAVRIDLNTTGGVIACRVHPAETGDTAVLWLCGAPGWGGPAGGLYERLARLLARDRILSVELSCRLPHDLLQSLLDAVMGVGYLDALDRKKVILVGHSAAAPVAISAAAQSPNIVGLAALASQIAGTSAVGDLVGKSILLMHGDADPVASEAGSRELYALAQEPKKLIVYPACGHEFDECREQVEADLLAWIRQVARVGVG